MLLVNSKYVGNRVKIIGGSDWMFGLSGFLGYYRKLDRIFW